MTFFKQMKHSQSSKVGKSRKNKK